MGSHIVYIGSIKIDIGTTFKGFSSGALIPKDDTCLTCYKLNGGHPTVWHNRSIYKYLFTSVHNNISH